MRHTPVSMNDDPLQYEKLIEDALRGVVRKALAIVDEYGLPNGHQFQITFHTDHPDVDMPPALRAQYPQEMTIILQHMFWDLEVGEDRFSVALAFNTVRQHLTIPFEAISIFQDQSVGFVLQFQNEDGAEDEDDVPAENDAAPDAAADPAESDGEPKSDPDTDAAAVTSKVVTLDSFRKK